MKISGNDLITALALVVSLASAFYAKRAVDLSRAANRINLHQPRAEIFKAIFDYRALFVEMDLHPTVDEMQHFYRDAVLPAHIYLSADFTEKMHEIYTRSRELYRAIDDCESGRSTDSRWTYINQLQELGKNDLDQLIRDLTRELDLGNT